MDDRVPAAAECARTCLTTRAKHVPEEGHASKVATGQVFANKPPLPSTGPLENVCYPIEDVGDLGIQHPTTVTSREFVCYQSAQPLYKHKRRHGETLRQPLSADTTRVRKGLCISVATLY
jgi:hypothetical protein